MKSKYIGSDRSPCETKGEIQYSTTGRHRVMRYVLKSDAQASMSSGSMVVSTTQLRGAQAHLFAVIFCQVFLPLVLAQEEEVFLELVHRHEVELVHRVVARPHQQNGKRPIHQCAREPAAARVQCSRSDARCTAGSAHQAGRQVSHGAHATSSRTAQAEGGAYR